MKALRVFLLITVVAGLAFAVKLPVQAQEYATYTCKELAATSPFTLSSTEDASGYFEPVPFLFSVELGTATSAIVQITNGGGTTYAGPFAVPGSVVIDMSTIPQPTTIAIEILSLEPARSTIELWISCAGAGCDTQISIPPQAVVGQFNANSELYWSPGNQIFPMLYVETGNTYYVAGQDQSEQYYKILLACDWLWVRKETVGPNYDDVWQGKPLPTDIVQ